MGSKVKGEIAAPPTALEIAGAANDDYVASLGALATETLASICRTGEDERARVSASKELLTWIRPAKSGPLIAINNGPAYHSHLNLPETEPLELAAIDVEARGLEKKAPVKILPESKGHMADARLVTTIRGDMPARESAFQEAPPAPSLPSREVRPHAPTMPASASSIRRF